MKTIFAPHLRANVILGGRRRPSPHTQKLYFSRYASKLPAPPATVNYAPKALAALRQMYDNDQLGDCVIAGGYHAEGVVTGNASGTPFVATLAQVIKDYGAIGGYVPGEPSTDQGCDEQTALNYWQQKGFANGSKLTAWLAVDASNKAQVQQAMWLFENLFFGLELPDAWVNPFPSADGFVWDVSPDGTDPDNGHCVVGVGYDARGIQVATWALLGTLTYAALEYATPGRQGELYVLLTADLIAKGQAKSPSGFDWATLVQDFDALGGKVPVPTPPAPPAPPTPTPPTPPTPTPPSPAPLTRTIVVTGATKVTVDGKPV